MISDLPEMETRDTPEYRKSISVHFRTVRPRPRAQKKERTTHEGNYNTQSLVQKMRNLLCTLP